MCKNQSEFDWEWWFDSLQVSKANSIGCFFGLHRWSPWGTPTVDIVDMKMQQIRRCTRCNMIQMRDVVK